MRVKLSYTVEEDAVLNEAAKLLQLSGEDMQHSIKLFSDVQVELKGKAKEDGTVNVPLAREMIEEFRAALLKIDTRLMEVAEIVAGYDEYRVLSAKTIDADEIPPLPLDESDYFGAD
jgi:hypothetical protein